MGQSLCTICGTPAVYGAGGNAKCYNCLPDNMKGSDYMDYHTPIHAKEKHED